MFCQESWIYWQKNGNNILLPTRKKEKTSWTSFKDIASTLHPYSAVTHHKLPVLSESRILYVIACSEHRCTCCAQTIKRSTGSCCSAHITVRVQAVPCSIIIKRRYAVLKGRRERDIIRPPAPVQIAPRVTDRYRVVFWKWIPRRNKSGWDSRGNADLDCCDARLLFVRCAALSSWVQF